MSIREKVRSGWKKFLITLYLVCVWFSVFAFILRVPSVSGLYEVANANRVLVAMFLAAFVTIIAEVGRRAAHEVPHLIAGIVFGIGVMLFFEEVFGFSHMKTGTRLIDALLFFALGGPSFLVVVRDRLQRFADQHPISR